MNGLHITGHADDQVVDLVIAEPKGRVLGIYRGANGEIAVTAAEARFLLEALPAMIARAEYLDHMGPLPDLDPTGDAKTQTPDNEIDRSPRRAPQIAQGEESARVDATTPAQLNEQGGAALSQSTPKQRPQFRGRGVQCKRSGRARAGQPWHGSEDSVLISGYRAGQGIKDLARIHGRSTKAIALRLERLGVCLPPVAREPDTRGTASCHA